MTGNYVTLFDVTGSNPEVALFGRKSTGSGCSRLIAGVLDAYELLQGCNSQEAAVTWQEMMSHDLMS